MKCTNTLFVSNLIAVICTIKMKNKNGYIMGIVLKWIEAKHNLTDNASLFDISLIPLANRLHFVVFVKFQIN